MHVCICVCAMSVYVCVCAMCVYLGVHVCVCAMCMYLGVHVCVCAMCVYLGVYVCVCCVCVCVCVCVHTILTAASSCVSCPSLLLPQVISACEGSSVYIWDINTGALVLRCDGCHGHEEVTSLTLDASGRQFITGSRGGDVKVRFNQDQNN